MLSILIPTYNYNVYPLFLELQKQCELTGIKFEILVQDDASKSVLNAENQKINQFLNCNFYENKTNLGRSNNRNNLAKKANFEWILFLDCDTFPENSNFISNYLHYCKTNLQVINGGIIYQKAKPKNSELLRWAYGNKREAISVESRKNAPIETALISNLMIKKEIFLKLPFDSELKEYGYEDYLFFLHLKENKIHIEHTNNAVFHLDLETSEIFLAKTKLAVQNLIYIGITFPELTKKNKVMRSYKLLKKLHAKRIFAVFYEKFESQIIKNLKSNRPSLFLFDLYKLGNFIKLKKQ